MCLPADWLWKLANERAKIFAVIVKKVQPYNMRAERFLVRLFEPVVITWYDTLAVSF